MAARPAGAAGALGQGPDPPLRDDRALPLFPLQPPRTGRELLADHITAMVCCAAMDTAGATPGLDWLDGPTLLLGGVRAADLSPQVLTLIEDGDPAPPAALADPARRTPREAGTPGLTGAHGPHRRRPAPGSPARPAT